MSDEKEKPADVHVTVDGRHSSPTPEGVATEELVPAGVDAEGNPVLTRTTVYKK